MKKLDLKKNIAVVLLAITVGIILSSADALAGSSDIVIDDSSFAESLNSSLWSDPNSDIVISNGKISFSNASTVDTRLITKNAITKSSQHDELFQAEATMKLQEIPKDGKFAAAFSLASMESVFGEEESIALVFTNIGGVLKVGLYTYDADGKETAIVNAKSAGVSFGQTVTVKVAAMKDMQFVITVNGTVFYRGQSPVDLTGRIGFLQDAVCVAEISHINIISHKYDTPENPNVVEDFEQKTINVNAFDSYMNSSSNYFPSGLCIEEYNGKNVLMFRNVGMGWFGTTYKYSNFECTFDVPYILFNNILREDGTVRQPASSGFIFSYGDLSDYYDSFGYETAADAIIFENNEIRNIKDYSKRMVINNSGLYDRDNNVGYSVKIRVEDTQFTLHIKPMGSSQWQEILSYKIGNETPTGYVHIWSAGCGNFAIDNFSITNLDKDAKLIDVKYQGSAIEGAEDWDYEPMKKVYLEDARNGQNHFNGPLLLMLAFVVGLVIVGVCLFVARKKVAKKEAENHAD